MWNYNMTLHFTSRKLKPWVAAKIFPPNGNDTNPAVPIDHHNFTNHTQSVSFNVLSSIHTLI